MITLYIHKYFPASSLHYERRILVGSLKLIHSRNVSSGRQTLLFIIKPGNNLSGI